MPVKISHNPKWPISIGCLFNYQSKTFYIDYPNSSRSSFCPSTNQFLFGALERTVFIPCFFVILPPHFVLMKAQHRSRDVFFVPLMTNRSKCHSLQTSFMYKLQTPGNNTNTTNMLCAERRLFLAKLRRASTFLQSCPIFITVVVIITGGPQRVKPCLFFASHYKLQW